MPLSLNTKFKQNPKVIKKVVKGRVYIFTPKNIKLHSFNEVASFIWVLAKKPVSFKKLVERVTKKFIVSEKKAQKDIEEFITYCLKNNFLLRVFD